MLVNGDNVVAETLLNVAGGYVQINNLLVEVKRSSDRQGYVIDIFNNDTEDLVDSVTVWNDDLESEETK